MKFNKTKHPFICDGVQYAKDILEGKIVSNVYVMAVCKRFFENFDREDIWFNTEAAEKFLRLAQKFNHVKGNDWKSTNLTFEPWQNFLFLNIYGWFSHETKNRVYRTVYCEVARGNGKSPMASLVGLYHLALENPHGNEVYSAATGKDQARIILDSARAMAKANPSFLANTGTQVLAHKIIHPSSNSEFRALSSDSNTLDGLQPAAALIDEVHAHKTREVYDVIDSAMSKRRDSLMFMITTAGLSTAGIGYSQSCYAKKVAIGDVEDRNFFAMVYTLDEEDDWQDEKVWIKANPNFGVSVDPINFRAKATKARVNPEDENNFKVKHLNLWSNSTSPFFDLYKWDKCVDKEMSLDQFEGERAWCGLDLASKIDITSFCMLFKKKGIYYIFDQSFCPKETIDSSENVLYSKCVATGHLIATQGEAINYPKLQADILGLFKRFKFTGVHFDPWNGTEMAQRLIAKRLDMIEFRMTTANLSEPMKRLDALVREGKIRHNGSPLLRWTLGNVVAKFDANDNVFPRKEHEKLKIDPIIAIIMALAGWITEEERRSSVYEERGVVVL